MPAQQVEKVQDVFRPGKAEPTDMYISRPRLERELADSLESDQVSLLIGGSGSGKSWLYKKFFADKKVQFSILSVPRAYSTPLRELMEKELAKLQVDRPVRERRAANASNIFGVFGASREVEREIRDEDVFLLIARELRARAKRRPAYIVLENAEQGLSDPSGQFVNEVANLVMLANSDEIVKAKVRFIIVSADDELRTSLARLSNSEPIMRRLRPLPEVSSFSDDEAKAFLKRGFQQKLKLGVANIDELIAACKDATDLRPDFMNEFCLLLAKEARHQIRQIDDRVIAAASIEWSKSKLGPYIERIAAFMNKKDTRKRVRDKILYSLSKQHTTKGFTIQNILDTVRREFESDTFQRNEITAALNVLCTHDGTNAPLIRQFGNESNPLYGFVGAIERIATAFTLVRKDDEILRHHYTGT